ncbi:MAG: hypothetical protein Q4B22_10465 [Eubacteriales bacterium]|nr:hypothetical protein [Eubacteriales bacterium]
MTDKELRRLKRENLLALLVDSETANRELRQQLQEEREKNEELHRQLEDRQIKIEEAGNIADASLKVNRIFEEAQAAAKDYLDNIRSLEERKEKEFRELEEETKAKTERLLEETKTECEELRRQTGADCTEQRAQTKAECNRQEELTIARCKAERMACKREIKECWEMLSQKLQEFYDSHQGLREQIDVGDMMIPSFEDLEDMDNE